MNRELLETLSRITPEEEKILNGTSEMDKSIYMESNGNTVSSAKFIESGKLITVRPHTRFVHFPQHTHDYVELVYMYNGETTHIVNGNTTLLRKGELLFLGQNATQEILPAGCDDIAVNFIIRPEFFGSTLAFLGEEKTPLSSFITDCLCKSGDNLSNYLHFKVSDVPPVQNIMENLIWTLTHGSPNKRNINQTGMGLLLMYLLDCTDRLSPQSSESEFSFSILRYIEEHYVSGNLTELAENMHYDFTWLSRQIKLRMGKTYTELVQEKRLSQAAYLLKNTKKSVAEVSCAVGYDNVSFFHRIFKARFGLSPGKYRKNK